MMLSGGCLHDFGGAGAECGQGPGCLRRIHGAEARIEHEGAREASLCRAAVSGSGMDHAGVEEKASFRRPITQGLADLLPGLFEAAILVVAPGQSVGSVDALTGSVLLL